MLKQTLIKHLQNEALDIRGQASYVFHLSTQKSFAQSEVRQAVTTKNRRFYFQLPSKRSLLIAHFARNGTIKKNARFGDCGPFHRRCWLLSAGRRRVAEGHNYWNQCWWAELAFRRRSNHFGPFFSPSFRFRQQPSF